MNELAHRIQLATGDITRLKVDAIVTAAISALREGGRGVVGGGAMLPCTPPQVPNCSQRRLHLHPARQGKRD